MELIKNKIKHHVCYEDAPCTIATINLTESTFTSLGVDFHKMLNEIKDESARSILTPAVIDKIKEHVLSKKVNLTRNQLVGKNCLISEVNFRKLARIFKKSRQTLSFIHDFCLTDLV